MARENRYLLMVINIKDFTRVANLMVKVDTSGIKEAITKGISKKVLDRVKEYGLMKMELFIRENSKKIVNMDGGYKNIKVEKDFKDNLVKDCGNKDILEIKMVLKYQLRGSD